MSPGGTKRAIMPPRKPKSFMNSAAGFRKQGDFRSGKRRHRYMGMLQSWKGKYHQLY